MIRCPASSFLFFGTHLSHCNCSWKQEFNGPSVILRGPTCNMSPATGKLLQYARGGTFPEAEDSQSPFTSPTRFCRSGADGQLPTRANWPELTGRCWRAAHVSALLHRSLIGSTHLSIPPIYPSIRGIFPPAFREGVTHNGNE